METLRGFPNVPPGEYELRAAASSRDVRLRATAKVPDAR
jgi:hypothetical protein